MHPVDPLTLFLPPVRDWFRARLGEPTPVQRQGWPVIASGQSALLLAPTGSGKTFAAFLACLDGLWRQDPIPRGVQILYISPLKALNNDIYRNLQIPLIGVSSLAEQQNTPLPKIDIAIRTGDTPTAERQRLLRHPPHVLITTPESLHLLLTSKARETLRGVTHCIIDEIHALCPNKRGVFLALLLERLQQLNAKPFARIGLSATQRPLEEVARYLGGFSYTTDGQWRERPVTIVDAGLRKNLDLQVVSPVEYFGPLPEKSIWPSIYRKLADEVNKHRSTIIFANNRRSVERITAQLNECLATDDVGEATSPDEVIVRAHHGSVALEVRQQTEQALKEGRLRAVVATASLELGIDMGAVDLVCQVESPGNVARALQRVGRAGHLVGQSTKGRLIPKTLPDLLNQAVLAAEMIAGRVEELRVPVNCLDVLAQQVIAMVAMDAWPVNDLYHLIRHAYPYRDLTPAAFDAVLEMVTGRFRFEPIQGEPPVRAAEPHTRSNPARQEPRPPKPGTNAKSIKPTQQLSALQPRISWDRVHQCLHALPGSQRLALVHGGTIPDTGQYAVYTAKGLRIGEVDEEFVYERRVGDTFLLGTNAWRIDRIETDRVLVTPAEGAPAMAPFWRGESTGRSYDLGLAQGKFVRELAERLDQPDCLDWLKQEHHLDGPSAANVRDFVRRQITRTNCVPSDRTLLVEATRDPLGDWQVVLLSPFGRALNLSLRLVLEHRLRDRLGYRPQCMHHDDGVLIRLTESDEPVLDLFDGLTPDNVRDMILEELADSALFALRFRQNAARALMMPRGAAGKRAPLWLQRLRGRDLLQVARRHPDFPIVTETFRECLHDHLDLARLQELLQSIASGVIKIETRRLDMPSPFAASLLFAFTMAFMYQYDDVEPDGNRSAAPLDQGLLDQLIGHDARHLPLDPRAVAQVDRRLRGVGHPPRSKTEAAEWLRRLGDVALNELEGPLAEFLSELERDGIAIRITLLGVRDTERWVLAEEVERYRCAFANDAADAQTSQDDATLILRRFLETHALIGLDDVLSRYPLERTWAEQQLHEWTRSGRLMRITVSNAEPLQWSAPENYEQMQRGTLSILRQEVMTCPASQFADFLLRWQYLHPAMQQRNAEGLPDVLHRLQGCALPLELWDHAVLPMRVQGYQSRQLDGCLATGEWTWHAQRPGESDALAIAFLPRDAIAQMRPPILDGVQLDTMTANLMEALGQRGALFAADLAGYVKLPITTIRAGLWTLLRLGLVTNDQFDVLRRGEPPRMDETPQMRSRGEVRAFLRDERRRHDTTWPEGRWSLLHWRQPDPESDVYAQTRLLLQRYGIVSREMALMSGLTTPWRLFYEILSRLELAGEVRRGYFVEGLSGAQFALPEATRQLQEIGLPSSALAPAILIHSLDPANLYGSGAALELPSLQSEPRAFLRRPPNWLVIKAGRPLLLIEQQGRRLTTLTSIESELAQAVARLPDIAKLTASGDVRHRLTVETWNEEPITSTIGRELLAQNGFVRDYQAMTLYAVWQ
jgi:ATP-dependent Lhr-like helicase